MFVIGVVIIVEMIGHDSGQDAQIAFELAFHKVFTTTFCSFCS